MTSAAEATDGGRSIGEVIAALCGKFPDVSISKVRLWEAEGIIRPTRTPSGYRKFSAEDVCRLEYAMTLQQQHYWPLRRIREHLQAIQQGTEQPVDTESAVPTREDLPPKPVKLSAGALCRQAKISPEQLEEYVTYGLLTPSSAGWYRENDVLIVRSLATLLEFGVTGRHLKFIRTMADRELDLISQVIGPRRRAVNGSGPDAAQKLARELAAASQGLHQGLIRAGLQRAGLG